MSSATDEKDTQELIDSSQQEDEEGPGIKIGSTEEMKGAFTELFEACLSSIPDRYILHTAPAPCGNGPLEEARSHHTYQANITINKRTYSMTINISQKGEHNWIHLDNILQ